MMHSFYRYIGVVACATMGYACQAQTLTLEQCLKVAAEHNMALRTADAETARTRSLQGTAWDVERTELSLTQDPTSGGSPDNAIALSQTIEFPTVYAARHRQLKAETKVQESKRNVTATAVRAEITAAYYKLVYQQERVNILMAHDSLLQRYADVAQLRYKAGEARQLEWLTAARMVRENRMELEQAKNDMAVGKLDMATALGTDISLTPADSKLVPVCYQPQHYSWEASAEGQLAQNECVAAQKALRTAQNGYAPTITLALKNQMVIKGWDPYHENRARYAGGNFMGFEVGIGVPLFFGATRAKVKAARQEQQIAQLNMQRAQWNAQKEYDAAMCRYNTAFNRMQYYNGEAATDAAETIKLAATEYEQGEIAYTEYVNALQVDIDVRMRRAEAINDYNQAVVALQRITGK